ncbi:MAG: carbohydrate kinase, partial [Planctomycetes bacterium]|nr:carbohydrate kinase [Planctomycetota bacterium]
MGDYQIIVLDIGKTNKKLFVYDSSLRCLNPGEKGAVFAEVERDGVRCDDMPAIHRWTMDGLRAAARRYKAIRCISISTHGATIALLGNERDVQFKGDGGLAFPIVSYAHDIGPDEDAAFYRDLGLTPEAMQERTATARFGWFINHGKQLWWLKKRFPEQFAQVTRVLMFPQYFGYLLTGNIGIEPTYVGCHGYLLDADGKSYSAVAKKLGVVDKLPPLPCRNTWESLGALKPEVARQTGLRQDCLVAMGVHDSNAALVPYFVKGFKSFAVQDSGTWIVTMSPRPKATF